MPIINICTVQRAITLHKSIAPCGTRGRIGPTPSLLRSQSESDRIGGHLFAVVDTRKPEKRVLEVEGHARDLHMCQHTSLASDSV